MWSFKWLHCGSTVLGRTCSVKPAVHPGFTGQPGTLGSRPLNRISASHFRLTLLPATLHTAQYGNIAWYKWYTAGKPILIKAPTLITNGSTVLSWSFSSFSSRSENASDWWKTSTRKSFLCLKLWSIFQHRADDCVAEIACCAFLQSGNTCQVAHCQVAHWAIIAQPTCFWKSGGDPVWKYPVGSFFRADHRAATSKIIQTADDCVAWIAKDANQHFFSLIPSRPAGCYTSIQWTLLERRKNIFCTNIRKYQGSCSFNQETRGVCINWHIWQIVSSSAVWIVAPTCDV